MIKVNTPKTVRLFEEITRVSLLPFLSSEAFSVPVLGDRLWRSQSEQPAE